MIKKVIFCVDLNEPSALNKDVEANIEKRFVHGRSLDDLLKQYAAVDLESASGSGDGDFSDSQSENDDESGNEEAAEVDKRFVHGRGLLFDDNESADEDFSE